MIRVIFLSFAFVFAAVLGALAQGIDETPSQDEALEREARQIMQEIRCLTCQNQSIDESNADMARTLRSIVRERVMLGESREEIKAFLVERYGDWILMNPPLRVRTFLLWGAPLLFMVLGLVFLFLRHHRKEPELAPLSEKEERTLKKILEGEE